MFHYDIRSVVNSMNSLKRPSIYCLIGVLENEVYHLILELRSAIN